MPPDGGKKKTNRSRRHRSEREAFPSMSNMNTRETKAGTRTETTSGAAPRSGASGPHVPAPLHGRRDAPVRRDRMGAPHGRDHEREGRGVLRAEGRRGPEGVVDDGDEHRRAEVLLREGPARRSASAPSGSSSGGSSRRSRASASRAVTSARPPTGTPSRDELAHILVNQAASFNSPVLVQRRRRAEAAGLRVLHQLRGRLDVLDPRPREDRGDALQVRLGHGLEPLLAALVDRSPSPRAASRRAPSPS